MKTSLQEECKKVAPDMIMVTSMMSRTFPLRRQEIVKNCPRIELLQQQWPALFIKREVRSFLRMFLFDMVFYHLYNTLHKELNPSLQVHDSF